MQSTTSTANGSSLPPKHVQVLVVGGGPAGSYSASVLAREGLDVAVFESVKFPRYHVGESLISSIHHYMRFIDAEEKVRVHGFTYKPGAALKFTQFKGEGYTDFIAFGHGNHAWNVVRSEFDELLLNHSKTCGAQVFEQTRVKALNFSPTDPTRPVSVDWVHTPYNGSSTTPVAGTTTFDFLVDASGRAGVMSAHLKNRKFNESLRNLATWGYWTGTGTYGKGTPREGAPWFEALTDESGWAWFIPLHDGTTSVGVVRSKDAPLPKPDPTSQDGPAISMLDKYKLCLAMAPNLKVLLGTSAELDPKSIKSASDYSYSSPSYAGPGYRIVGDAGCTFFFPRGYRFHYSLLDYRSGFIDPLFSSGIHLALTSALSAAASICAELRGDADSSLAERWHSRRVAISYTRLVL
jgi:flavin-dependent dehydrogenase